MHEERHYRPRYRNQSSGGLARMRYLLLMAGLLLLQISNRFVSAWTTTTTRRPCVMTMVSRTRPAVVMSSRSSSNLLLGKADEESSWQYHHVVSSNTQRYRNNQRPKTMTQLEATGSGGSSGDNDNNNNKETPNKNKIVSAGSALDLVGILIQPVVWISLVSVATTGGGLPAGPFGLVGAVEGLSYLLVVVLAGTAIWSTTSTTSTGSLNRNKEDDGTDEDGPATSEQLSLGTLALALLVLVQLIANQGCVPNAKPILDYSAYIPVCNAETTPGFFGGQ
jgi:hypothetical protein